MKRKNYPRGVEIFFRGWYNGRGGYAMSVREYDLQINDEEKLPDIIQALNASVRRKMMSLLSRSSYS